MKRLALVFLMFCALTPAAARADAVAGCSRVEADGSRTLCHEAVVPASQAEVWRLLSTADGLASWAAPVVGIDLRIGGIREASYNPAARLGDADNIRNRILSYLPGSMMSMAVDSAPPGFDHADLVKTLWTVIELEPVDATHTRVRVSMAGYGAGEGYDALYAFFDRGNAWTLAQLVQRVESGPTDWRATHAPGARR